MEQKLTYYIINVGVGIDQKSQLECFGNKAGIIICDKYPEQKVMSKIVQKFFLPIIVFICQVNKETYQVKYFMTSGDELALCGHGSIGLGQVIKQHFSIEEGKTITLQLNGWLDQKEIKCIIKRNESQVMFPVHEVMKAPKELNDEVVQEIKEIFFLKENEFNQTIYVSTGIVDCLIEILDGHKMRELDFKYDEPRLARLQKKHNFRSVSVTAKSADSNYLYENRVFAPLYDIVEDSLCGSINCAMVRYWLETSNYIKDGEEFQMFYPYKMNSKKQPGGMLKITYCEDIKQIKISSITHFLENHKEIILKPNPDVELQTDILIQ